MLDTTSASDLHLRLACARLRRVLISNEKTSVEGIYDDILTVLGGELVEPPVIFLGKWLNSDGTERTTKGTWAARSLSRCRRRTVVLLERSKGLNCLQEGIQKARAKGAHTVGLMTGRRQFPCSELAFFAEHLDWALVTDDLAEQKHHLDTHCPGKFRTFPIPYQLQPAA